GLLDEVTIYNRVLSAAEIQAIFNAGSAGKCTQGADLDGDGVLTDACPASDLQATVVLDGCVSAISNPVFPSGCSLTDLLMDCAVDVRRHSQFVQCVTQLTSSMERLGMITDQQRSALQACAGQAAIP